MSEFAPDETTIVRTVETSFEAHALVALLEAAEIDAVPVEGVQRTGPLPVTAGAAAVGVQVKRADLERAEAALRDHERGADPVDWAEVDVGGREDDLPLTTPGRVPLPARIALVVILLGALLVLIVSAASWLLT